MSKLTRRNFIKTSAAASSVFPLVTLSGTKASGNVLGANERIRVATDAKSEWQFYQNYPTPSGSGRY